MAFRTTVKLQKPIESGYSMECKSCGSILPEVVCKYCGNFKVDPADLFSSGFYPINEIHKIFGYPPIKEK